MQIFFVDFSLFVLLLKFIYRYFFALMCYTNLLFVLKKDEKTRKRGRAGPFSKYFAFRRSLISRLVEKRRHLPFATSLQIPAP